jgi:hypothetical protein
MLKGLRRKAERHHGTASSLLSSERERTRREIKARARLFRILTALIHTLI